MKTKLSLAVAAALFAASSAQAGISIPAGDWTVDIGGNVNAFYILNDADRPTGGAVAGGLANTPDAATGNDSVSSINTGLLPSWLGVGAKTRMNDLDVGFTISFQPGASSKTALGGGSGSEFRQAFLTFGDASWGTIKIGKDIGVFGQNAILLDQTLLGVGSQGLVGAAGGTTTTLGRIGTGFLYTDFKGQINYTSPNWNGFSFTAGIAQPWSNLNISGLSNGVQGGQEQPAFEGVVQYAWTGDVSGKVWGEFLTQQVALSATTDDDAQVFGIGANVNFGGFGLTGYYYDGEGVGTTCLLCDGYTAAGLSRDSDGYYVQGSFTIPGIGTKLAASWGESNLDAADAADRASALVETNEMWVIGAYHPLTKHLNLVAEYANVEASAHNGNSNESNSISLGAILFF